MSSTSRLHRLPSHTVSNIRSTQILTSIAQIVAEVVQNSLDAGALHIDIGVDCEEWSCWVIDDGSGMSKDELSKLANSDGTSRYCEYDLVPLHDGFTRDMSLATSKAYDFNSVDWSPTYGFRGEGDTKLYKLIVIIIDKKSVSNRVRVRYLLRRDVVTHTVFQYMLVRYTEGISG